MLRCQRCARERPAVCQAAGRGLAAARYRGDQAGRGPRRPWPAGLSASLTRRGRELPATRSCRHRRRLHRVGGAGGGRVVCSWSRRRAVGAPYRAPEEALATWPGPPGVGGRGTGVSSWADPPARHPVLQAALRADSGRWPSASARAPGAGPPAGTALGRAVRATTDVTYPRWRPPSPPSRRRGARADRRAVVVRRPTTASCATPWPRSPPRRSGQRPSPHRSRTPQRI